MPMSSLASLPERPPTGLRLDSSFRLPRDPLGYHGLPAKQSLAAHQASSSQGRPGRFANRVVLRDSVVPSTLSDRGEVAPFLPRFSHSTASRMHPAGLQIPFRAALQSHEPTKRAAPPTMPPSLTTTARCSAWPSQRPSTCSNSLPTASDQLGRMSAHSISTHGNVRRRSSGLRNAYKPEADAPPSDQRMPARHVQPALAAASHSVTTAIGSRRRNLSAASRWKAAEAEAAKDPAATNRLPTCSLASRPRDEARRVHHKATRVSVPSAVNARKFVPSLKYTQAPKSASVGAYVPSALNTDPSAGLHASSTRGRCDGGADRRIAKLPARPRSTTCSGPLPQAQVPAAIFATPHYSPLPTRFQSPEDASPTWLAEALYGPSYEDWQEMRDEVEQNERAARATTTGGDIVNRRKRARADVGWTFELWAAEVEQRRRRDKRQKRR